MRNSYLKSYLHSLIHFKFNIKDKKWNKISFELQKWNERSIDPQKKIVNRNKVFDPMIIRFQLTEYYIVDGVINSWNEWWSFFFIWSWSFKDFKCDKKICSETFNFNLNLLEVHWIISLTLALCLFKCAMILTRVHPRFRVGELVA